MTVSASSCSFTYHVFLSFRGKDTRYGFTGNLYKALSDKGIRTFIDDEELQRGQEMTPSLLKAIEESRIAIIVLSNNYASSSFCLDELVGILDCIKGKGRLVLPIFYDVDPSDVRKQTGAYRQALEKHKERFNMERLQTWKAALQQVANLSGSHFKIGDRYEYKIMEEIVAHVWRKIERVALPVADCPVGLESRVQEVNLLLDVGCDNGVRMVGIHGIGKTTLASAVYNLIADHFDGVCFLENIRENSDKHGLLDLQNILLSQTLGEQKIKLTSVKQGISIKQLRLQQKKVLLILDDVDKEEQLEALVGGSDWLGSGSRVIITTRDKHLLARHRVDKTYELKELDHIEALRLLAWKAFKTEKVDPNYMCVLNHAVGYACGLPLALVVIGSNLFGKSIEEWNSALDRYKSIPNKEIQQILKVSFDALEEDEQSVFLDIACCYKGHELSKVEDMLHAHYGDCMKYHIGVLVEKSLVEISWHGTVILHDLIEDMGKEIVRQESVKEPGKRSRLWFHKDIAQVLEENTGTGAIEIINYWTPFYEEVIEMDDLALKKMKNLKTLIIRSGHFCKGPKHLPNSLRVLEWWRYPSQDLPYDFHPKELAIFNLPRCCLMSFKLADSSKKFVNMRVLKFDYANCLTQIPDVSSLPNLEDFSFVNCQNLITLHESVGFLNKLEVLNASGCSKLKSFPPLKLISLRDLNPSFCSSLECFPEILGRMENITGLVLVRTPIKELPFSFHNLTCLRKLELDCPGMLRLPRSIVMMRKLVNICGFYWKCEGWLLPKQDKGEEKVSSMVSSNIECIILSFSNLSNEFLRIGLTLFVNVRELYLQNNNFTILPECIKECRFLRTLYLDYCQYLREVKGIAPNLETFSAKECKSLTCTDMLLNQELHEAGNTEFYLPGAKIPDWFEHRSNGGSISFWCRNKFPAIALCLVATQTFTDSSIEPVLFIKGLWLPSYYLFNPLFLMIRNHTYIFGLETVGFQYILDEKLIKNGWNHVEIKFPCLDKTPLPIEGGIHVLKQKSSMEDIQFTDPYGKRKLHGDLSSSKITKPRQRVKLSN